MRFSRQEYWNGLPFPSPGDLPNPGIESGCPALQAICSIYLFLQCNTSAMICLKQLIWYYWAQSWEEMPTVFSGLLPASSSTSLCTEIWAQILNATIHLDLSFLIPSCLPPFSFSLPLSSSSFLSQESDLSSYRSHLELAQTMWIPFLSAL